MYGNFQHTTVNKQLPKRFWEIDFLRGIAVTMMIIFHILFDLNFFGIYKMELYSGFLLVFVYSIGTIFILLVGVSLTLSYARAEKTLTKKELHVKYLTRGLKVFGLGLVVTLATWLYLPRGFIVFGVLHCIGISIILAYPLLRFRFQNVLVGLILILIGIVLETVRFDFYWLLWLGFTPAGFYTVDYFPLLPWFGVVLLGICLGNVLYPNYKRWFKLRDYSYMNSIRLFCFLGRHSLIIYFLHQPVLIGLIHLFSG
jgi:uncharacterized membrane protein